MTVRLHIDVHLHKRTASGKSYWRAYWTDCNGEPQYKGLGNTDRVTKREAQRICRQMERDFAAGLVASNRPSKMPTLLDLIESGAESRKGNRPIHNTWLRTAELVKDWNATVELDQITRAMATGFREHLYKQGFQEQTVRNHLARIRAAINQQVRHEIVRVNVFDHLPCGVLRRDKSWQHIDSQTVTQVADHPDCHPDVRWMLLLARFAGLRANEIDRLCWEDVDLNRRVIRVVNPNVDGLRTTKKRERFVPIQPSLYYYLTCPMAGRILSSNVNNARHRYEDSCRAAGVEPWPEPLQVLRRCCISDWCSQGISAPDVAEIAGNSVQIIMDHYFQVRPETLRKIAHSGSSCLRAEVIALVEGMDASELLAVREALRSLQNLDNADPEQVPELVTA